MQMANELMKRYVITLVMEECSLVGLMLKLKLQYFGHLMLRADSFEKTLRLRKIEGGRRRGRQKMRWLDSINDSMDMSLRKLPWVGDGQGNLVCCSPWGRKELDRTEWLFWTEMHQDKATPGVGLLSCLQIVLLTACPIRLDCLSCTGLSFQLFAKMSQKLRKNNWPDR